MKFEKFMMNRIPAWLLVFTIAMALIFTVIFGWFVKRALHGDSRLGAELNSAIITIADFPSLVKKSFSELGENRLPLLVANKFPEIDGFRKNGVTQQGVITDGGYLLISSYGQIKGQSAVKLVRIHDGQTVYEWVPDIGELKAQMEANDSLFKVENMKPSRFQMHHPLLLDDGGLIIKQDGPLLKINICSRFEWINNGFFHHSTERNGEGGFWVPSHADSYHVKSAEYSGHVNESDDSIAKISPDGKLLFNKSVPLILEENGYRGLLFGVGPYEWDAIHLNDIQEAQYSTEYWEKGDLLVSVRNLSTVFLYRPATNKIIWLKTGPWLNQHDVDFIGQSKISVFGNDVVRTVKGPLIEFHNNVYLYDFADGTISTPYANILKRLDVQTTSGGRQEILANGDLFVEETDRGRILRLSSKEVIWEFTVKIDENSVGIGQWSRYLTEGQVHDVLSILERSNCQ